MRSPASSRSKAETTSTSPGAPAPLGAGAVAARRVVLPAAAEARARVVAGEHVQARAGQRVNQAPVGGDAVAGLLVDDREDQAAALVASEHGHAGVTEVILWGRVVAGRQRVVAFELLEH